MVRSFNIISRKKKSSTGSQGGELCVSEKAKAVLHLLRKKGPPLSAKQLDYCNEACIGRILKAKVNNVKKAAKQLRATLAWRASLDIDYLTADEFSAELACGSAYVAGQDEEGRPVLVINLKPEWVSGQAQRQFIRYFVFTMEVAIACMPPSVEQCVLILDAAACQKRGSPGFSAVVQLLKVLGEHYPERLARCFIVDAPAMFFLLWKGISQVLDLKVREKPRFVYSKKYNSVAGVQKLNSSASVAANHLMRAAKSYSSRNLWAGEDQVSDEEEEHYQRDKIESRTPSMPRTSRTLPPSAVSCNSPPAISTSLYSLSSISPSSLSPSSTSFSLSSLASFSPSSTSLCISSSSALSSTMASLSSSLAAPSSSSATSSSCSASSSTSALCLHSNTCAALLSDKVHARSLSFASIPTCRKEAVSEFRSFRADTNLSRRINEDGVSTRWADLSFGPRNDELPPHHHQHVDYACKHKSATLFRPYYTSFLIPPYNEAAYRGRMKPPLAGLISIISPDLKYRRPSFSLHSTAMEAMLQHLHFD